VANLKDEGDENGIDVDSFRFGKVFDITGIEV
jgi:hypothetical protein